MMTAVFPVYYNLLSQLVTRRDELVLKRLRTGESTDAEIVVSLALPGVVVALVTAALAVPVALALGQPAPRNPLLHVVTVLATWSCSPRWPAGRPPGPATPRRRRSRACR